MSKRLTPAAVARMQEMYEEVDAAGRRKWTMAGIAEALGVGETTVYRAVKKRGGYAVPADPVQDAEAKASEARFKAQMEGVVEETAERALAREKGWI